MLEVLEGFVSSGHLCDLALLVFAAELVWLKARKVPLGNIAGQLVAGVFLLLATRAALTGAPALVTGGFLAASFPAHLYDVVRRARAR